MSSTLSAPHFVQGALVEGEDIRHRSRDLGADFVTPAIDLDALIMPRSELPPLLDVKLSEIVDFLVEAGERLQLDRNPHLQECLELIAATNPLPPRVVENLYREAPYFLTRHVLESIVDSNFANREALDGWVERVDAHGNKGAVRAFPPRMVHMLAGNAPSGCVSSIAQGALVKAVNIFKMPSSDPFTTVAVLRTMAEIDPTHPVVRSMSAVYWQGGDTSIERTLYRPQYIDKIVALGRRRRDQQRHPVPRTRRSVGVLRSEVVDLDDRPRGVRAQTRPSPTSPKCSPPTPRCSTRKPAWPAATRSWRVNRPQVEALCAKLVDRLGVDRDFASAVAPPLPADVRDEVEVMSAMGDIKVWGRFDGRGLVILSDEPVEFHPSNKTSNVVMVPSLDDAVRYVNVATQTIGVYPV